MAIVAIAYGAGAATLTFRYSGAGVPDETATTTVEPAGALLPVTGS